MKLDMVCNSKFAERSYHISLPPEAKISNHLIAKEKSICQAGDEYQCPSSLIYHTVK